MRQQICGDWHYEYRLETKVAIRRKGKRIPSKYYKRIRSIPWKEILKALGIEKRPPRQGRFYILCRFHSEKTPSFHLMPGGWYYCFGCCARGDVFQFILRGYFGFHTPPQVVAFFKRHFGISAPKQNG